MIRAILPLSFAALCLMIGNAALATVNAYQERQAEAICKVDPSYCGQTR